MALKKDKIIDKLVRKDYNNELEEVLTKKDYQEDVKNLLLDVLYKIETAYKDYETVKKNVLPKEKYIQNIIKTIKDDCDTIEFMKPDIKEDDVQTKRTFIVNKDKMEIKTYPISRKLLYCIAKIQKSENIIKSNNTLLNVSLTNMLNVGNNINTVEPLRDFNGFSWNISVLEIENLYYNLIYQDLIILVGNQFLEEWTNQNDDMVDYMEMLEEELIKRYGERETNTIIELLKRLSVLLEVFVNKDHNQEFIEELKIKQKEQKELLNKMANKEKYLEDLSKRRKELAKKIKEIDLLLSDQNLLDSEYLRRNRLLPLEKKIFSVRIFAKQLNKERKACLEEMEECKRLMNFNNFISKQKELERDYEYLRLIDVDDFHKDITKKLIYLQKDIIRCLKIKLKNISDKNELIKILYEIRYFNMLPIETNKKIQYLTEINKSLDSLKEMAINKGIQLEVISKIFKENEKTQKILKDIFSLDIISLEDLYFKIGKEKDKYFIQFFDENIMEEKFKIDFEFKQNELKTKSNKKTKLLII